jgi:oxygen-independent coproporphyrinogen-3 oxidase
VTRVSLGVQSFDDAELKFLGRVHSSIQAVEAVKICVSFGFDVSVDLMFGLPGQTLRGWSENLRRAASLTVGHISIYQLTIEPGTPLAARNLSLPDGYRPYRYAQWRLPRDGYEQYEVASFSRPGYESRHNLNYWADGGYIGLGPAAWSYIGGARSQNAPTLGEYSRMAGENGNAAIYSETLSPGPAARQAAILALRTRYGIDWISFEQKHGKVLKEEIEKILKVFPDSLVTMDKGRARFTPSGLRVANKIWEELV